MKKVQGSVDSLIGLYPHLEGQVHIEEAWAGYIDGTPDRTPVIGEVPGVKGFLFATGFSGHGFAMGPGTGRVMSEIILDGEASVDVNGLRFSRFKERDLNPEY
jgi:glycine/D-amino acid oxidase-like deaminating enzyme